MRKEITKNLQMNNVFSVDATFVKTGRSSLKKRQKKRKYGEKCCIWKRVLRFAAVNSHCRDRNMKKNPGERRNFRKFMADLRLADEDMLM